MCDHPGSYNLTSGNILRVPDENGVSLLYILLEIHHSGREPSLCLVKMAFFNQHNKYQLT